MWEWKSMVNTRNQWQKVKTRIKPQRMPIKTKKQTKVKMMLIKLLRNPMKRALRRTLIRTRNQMMSKMMVIKLLKNPMKRTPRRILKMNPRITALRIHNHHRIRKNHSAGNRSKISNHHKITKILTANKILISSKTTKNDIHHMITIAMNMNRGEIIPRITSNIVPMTGKTPILSMAKKKVNNRYTMPAMIRINNATSPIMDTLIMSIRNEHKNLIEDRIIGNIILRDRRIRNRNEDHKNNNPLRDHKAWDKDHMNKELHRDHKI